MWNARCKCTCPAHYLRPRPLHMHPQWRQPERTSDGLPRPMASQSFALCAPSYLLFGSLCCLCHQLVRLRDGGFRTGNDGSCYQLQAPGSGTRSLMPLFTQVMHVIGVASMHPQLTHHRPASSIVKHGAALLPPMHVHAPYAQGGFFQAAISDTARDQPCGAP
jgi:hypothetical protein